MVSVILKTTLEEKYKISEEPISVSASFTRKDLSNVPQLLDYQQCKGGKRREYVLIHS
jgi:hypothetical protein